MVLSAFPPYRLKAEIASHCSYKLAGGGIKLFRWLGRKDRCRGRPVVLKVIFAIVVDTKEPGIQEASTIQP